MFSIVYIDKHNQESGSYQIVDQCQIGRAKTCDICLLSLSNNISLVHAVIKKQGDSFTITPFGLVEINGVATQEPSLLNDNDLFSIANKKFRFVIGSYDPLAPSYSKHTLASAKKLKRPSSPRLTPSKRNCSPRPTPSKRARTSPIAPHSTPLKPSETPKKVAFAFNVFFVNLVGP